MTVQLLPETQLIISQYGADNLILALSNKLFFKMKYYVCVLNLSM